MKQRLSYFLRVILYGSVTRSWQVSYADRNGKPGADKQPALEATPENRTNKVFYKGHMLGIYFRFACVFGMLLTLLTSFTLPVMAQTWQPVGSEGFSTGGATSDVSFYIDNGTPYVAYQDASGITVMKYNGSAWVGVGSADFASGSYPSLYVYGGTPYVAYSDNSKTYRATVKKYDGTSWVTVGNAGFSAGNLSNTSLYVDNGTPYVAYRDGANGYKATVMEYNGTSWVTVGSAGFSTGQASYTSLYCDNGTPYVAYQDVANSYKATVMKYNGSTWEVVGSAGFSAYKAFYTSLYIDNGTPYVVYKDLNNSSKATVMKYNGSAWEVVGSAGFSAGNANYTSLYIDNGTPYVAYQDEANSNLVTVMKYALSPPSISYSSPQTYTKGNAITSLSPTSTGGTVASYSVSPALPAGLSLNATTGVISGTPTAITATATYTVTATNSVGSATANISITVNDIAPVFGYATPLTYTRGTVISSQSPTSTGGTVVSYSVTPALPVGLSLNTTTGVISGTPTAITATAIYTVTGTNTGGSATAQISITVNDVAPSISYSSPQTYTKGTAIASLSPTSTGGAVVSYSVSPALPAGLSLNTTTGVISGTPTAIMATATYTVTAMNTGGSATAQISITVNDVAPSISYSSPQTYTRGTAIASLSPTSTGGAVVSYSVSPALPAGLSLNTTTGVISGTPTAITATATYTVTATNTGGSATAQISITVNDVAPSISYSSPQTYTKGTAIASLSPTSTGGMVDSYSVSPALPAGLSLNTTTGVISGTPTAITATTTYTVTATNTGGSATAGISITVNDVAPSISYATPQTYTKGTVITALSPTSTGGAVVSYSVSPALPAGLSLNTTTGVISGTPTAVAATATYTVTATNTGGSATAQISITVNDVAPSISYATPQTYTRGMAIASLSPTSTGGTVVSYSVSPALPAGLSLNTTTGVISGTPTAITATATYTVTAANTGGSATAQISITVNDVAPSISYNSPQTYTRGAAITALSPASTGGMVDSYSVGPALPAGLSLNTTTGVISGTPTTVTVTNTYTITATNSVGSATAQISITVNDVAPAISYSSPQTYTRGMAITALSPTSTGGTVV
uniref:beta strand repeat-containing protein n=1 Tax=Prolixibacter bellariivorans TaxID=314319 RepID=UPI00190035FE